MGKVSASGAAQRNRYYSAGCALSGNDFSSLKDDGGWHLWQAENGYSIL